MFPSPQRRAEHCVRYCWCHHCLINIVDSTALTSKDLSHLSIWRQPLYRTSALPGLLKWVPKYLHTPTFSILVWGIFLLQRSISISFVKGGDWAHISWQSTWWPLCVLVCSFLTHTQWLYNWTCGGDRCRCYIRGLMSQGEQQLKDRAPHPVGPLCCKPSHQTHSHEASHAVVCWRGSWWSTQPVVTKLTDYFHSL